MAGCIAYAGKGFSAGVLHMLRASTRGRYCLPVADQGDTTADTKELDHLLAMHFGWWDVFVGKKKPVSATSATTASNGSASTGTLESHRHLPGRPRLPALAAGSAYSALYWCQREGRIQSAERAVPTHSCSNNTNLLSA